MGRVMMMRLDRDGWHEVHAIDLVEADLVYYEGNLIEVTGMPTISDGKINLPARLYQPSEEPSSSCRQ